MPKFDPKTHIVKNADLHAIYKCRLCLQQFSILAPTDTETACHHVMELAVSGKPDNVYSFPFLLALHMCDDGSVGLADFIGWRKEKDG